MEYKIFTKDNIKLENQINIIIECNKKDEQYEDLLQYIKRYNKEKSKKTKVIVKKDNKEVFINKEDILYYFSDKKYNYCKTMEDSYRIKSTLYELEEDSIDYIRISKSYVINTDKIKKFDMSVSGKITVIMEDDNRLQVSRRKICEIKDFLDERSL